MGLAQKWLTGLTFLGALGLILAKPKGFAALATGVENITGGTIAQITGSKIAAG